MPVTIDIFLQKTKKFDELTACTLLLGDELYYQDQASHLLKNLIFADIELQERSIMRIDKLTENELQQLEEFAYSSGFFANNRLVVITDHTLFAGKSKQEKLLPKLTEIVTNAPEDCYFLFVVDKLDKNMRSFKDYSRSNLYKLIDTKGKVVTCDSPRSYEVSNWLGKELRQRNIKLDSAAMDTIITYCNYTDKVPLSILANEFEKLSLVYPHKELISLDDFMAVSQLSMQVSVFKLVDYIWRKDTKYVLNICEELLRQGEPIESICFTLTGQLKRAIQLKMLDSAKISLADFIRETKMTEFVVNKLRKSVRDIPLTKLQGLFNELVQLMYQIRIGNKQPSDLTVTLLQFCK